MSRGFPSGIVGGVELPIGETDVSNLVGHLAAKAPLTSPTFTGTPTAPNPSTAQGLATKDYVDSIGGVTLPIEITDVTNLQEALDAKQDIPVPSFQATVVSGDLNNLDNPATFGYENVVGEVPEFPFDLDCYTDPKPDANYEILTVTSSPSAGHFIANRPDAHMHSGAPNIATQDAGGGGGVTLPIEISDVTNLQTALDAKAATSYVDSGDADTLASANSYTDAHSGGLAFSGARIRRTTDQNITNATWTSVDFTDMTPDYDSDAYWSNSNPTRLTIPATGIYRISGSVQFSSFPTSTAALFAKLNGGADGSAFICGFQLGANTALLFSFSQPVALTAGDYIELRAYQDGGGTLIKSLGNYSPVLAIERIG